MLFDGLILILICVLFKVVIVFSFNINLRQTYAHCLGSSRKDDKEGENGLT